jgi:hypothetical protein
MRSIEFHADIIPMTGTTPEQNPLRLKVSYPALRTLGVPARLVVYPGQHHVLITRPSFVKDLADGMSTWLDRYRPSQRNAQRIAR